ncbi:MAG: hypothetical protein ACTMH4_03480 [Sphingobacterium sp.]
MFEMLSEEVTQEMLQYAIVGGIIMIIIGIFFGYTIYSTLKLIKKENQNILPNQAWFVAIPFFNIYWNFEVVRRLTDSLNNEFYDRKVEVEERPTQKWGMLFAWTFLIRNIPLPPFILMLAFILNIAYFVTYWIKIGEYRSLLKMHIKAYGKDYIDQSRKNED